MQEADRLRKGEPKLGEGGHLQGVPLKNYKVWSHTALTTAGNDLIVNGVILVHTENNLRKIKELDFYLATRGIRFNREKQGDWDRLEYAGLGPKLVVCCEDDCMRMASFAWHYKPLKQTVFPACGEHVEEVREKLGKLVSDQMEMIELPLDWPPRINDDSDPAMP